MILSAWREEFKIRDKWRYPSHPRGDCRWRRNSIINSLRGIFRISPFVSLAEMILNARSTMANVRHEVRGAWYLRNYHTDASKSEKAWRARSTLPVAHSNVRLKHSSSRASILKRSSRLKTAESKSPVKQNGFQSLPRVRQTFHRASLKHTGSIFESVYSKYSPAKKFHFPR